MQRVFIAIPISAELQQQIHAFAQRFSELPVRWLEGKNLHITLVPPWETDSVDKIIKQLAQLKTTGSFEITFDHVSFGPDQRNPRLIWVTGEAPQGLLYLKRDIEQILNYTPDRKVFTMHASLARFKPHDFANFPIQTLDEHVAWTQPVTSFVLMESKLYPNGADYTILQEFSL